MRNILHKVFFNLFFALIISVSGFSQDIHFSQFFETPLLRNPALAGIFTGDLRIQAVYRTQWASVTVPYQTGSINAEYKLPIGNTNDFLSVGGEVLYDKAGTVALTATHILPVVNYHKSLSAERNMTQNGKWGLSSQALPSSTRSAQLLCAVMCCASAA